MKRNDGLSVQEDIEPRPPARPNRHENRRKAKLARDARNKIKRAWITLRASKGLPYDDDTYQQQAIDYLGIKLP